MEQFGNLAGNTFRLVLEWDRLDHEKERERERDAPPLFGAFKRGVPTNFPAGKER